MSAASCQQTWRKRCRTNWGKSARVFPELGGLFRDPHSRLALTLSAQHRTPPSLPDLLQLCLTHPARLTVAAVHPQLLRKIPGRSVAPYKIPERRAALLVGAVQRRARLVEAPHQLKVAGVRRSAQRRRAIRLRLARVGAVLEQLMEEIREGGGPVPGNWINYDASAKPLSAKVRPARPRPRR